MNIRDVLFCAVCPRGGGEEGEIKLEEFSELVAAIYDAALDPSLWDQTLKQVFSAAGANGGGLLVRDRRREPWRCLAAHLDSAEIRKYNEYYVRIAPGPPVLERTPAGVIVTSRAVSTEAQRRGEFYNDWANPNEVGDSVFVNLMDGPDALCRLGVTHPWLSEPFATPEVLRLVSLLVPHLQRAMQVQLGFGPLSLVRDGALDLVEHWRHGCVLVSFAGQVLYANRAANDIAASQDGLSVSRRGLRASVALDDAALQHLIRQACIGYADRVRSSGRLAISRGSGSKPYAIHVMPLRPRQAIFRNGPLAALVLIVDAERAAHLPPEDLQKLFDLTPAEAEVAIRVLRGHGLQYVGDELHVGLSTVRVHLQRVFEKTGTHRQAELVRLLTELAATNMPDSADGAADTRFVERVL